ncbi:prephenate dehydratase [Patescibacteria group bacterium]|nr:prephenate dehydratase [Patescibacteria group bacterium]
MKKTIIGISGDVGSFSAQAAEEYARKNDLTDYEIAYLIKTEKVLTQLDKKKINIGIFPIENSNGGIVIESINAMSHHIFKIKEIFEIPIVHCLLTKPGIAKKDIKTIASHDQALKQCKMYLKKKWEDVELKETEDTAKSAKQLTSGEINQETAVLAPEACATLYGLIVMEKGIQDLKFNFTNFLAVDK